MKNNISKAKFVLSVFSTLILITTLSGSSFLWKMKVDGKNSYILGSIHMMKKDAYPLKAEIEEAFKDSEYLVVEADISPSKNAEIIKLTFENAKYNDNSLLKDHISDKTFKLLQNKLKKLGMSLEFFKSFRPWFLAMTVTSMELVKLGFNPELGIDRFFIKKRSADKILELEGIKYQLELFNNFTDKESESFLLSSLTEADSLEKNIDKMVSAWRNGDTDRLSKLVTEDRKQYPDMARVFNIIIEKRNRRMVEKIESFIKSQKSCFIIVGAAHLVGDEGIINLLKQKGYSLVQL